MPIEYFQSQVAFLDVLGWKNLVERSVRDRELRERMASALLEAPQGTHHVAGPPPQVSGATLVGQFSDSIVLSYNAGRGDSWNAEGFYHSLWRTCFWLGRNGLFVRGGVGNGLMYHNGALAFGPALTAAADLEKVARVPRILMPESYVSNNRSSLDQLQHHEYGIVRRRPPDNRPFFDYLTWDFQWDSEMEPGGAVREVCNRLQLTWRNPIVAALQEHSAGDLRILGKYVWLADYFNEVAGEVSAAAIDLVAIIPDRRRLRRARSMPFI